MGRVICQTWKRIRDRDNLQIRVIGSAGRQAQPLNYGVNNILIIHNVFFGNKHEFSIGFYSMYEKGIQKVQILHAEGNKMIETDSLSTTMAVCSLEGWVSTLGWMIGSRMTVNSHVRIWESVRVRSPRATRLR